MRVDYGGHHVKRPVFARESVEIGYGLNCSSLKMGECERGSISQSQRKHDAVRNVLC